MKTWARQNKQKGRVIEITVGEHLRYTTRDEIDSALNTWPVVKRAVYKDTFAGGEYELFTTCRESKHREECLIVMTQKNNRYILVPNQLYAHDLHLKIRSSVYWKLAGENDQ